MKKLFSFSIFLLFFVNCFAQLKVNSSGNVGIGLDADVTSDLKLKTAIFVTGYVYPNLIIDNDPHNYGRAIYPSSNRMCRVGLPNNQFAAIYGRFIYQDGTLVSSDKRLKENFRKIENPLAKLLLINGTKYDLIDQGTDSLIVEKEKQKLLKLQKDNLGFIAQDLEKVVPEAVFYVEEEDKYYIEYNAIIPVIVEAIKEQQIQIETLKNELASCCQENLKSGFINESNGLKSEAQKSVLHQNIPNPFDVQTSIGYEIPSTVQKAQLHICNMTGTLLNTVIINQRGAGSIKINAYEFTAGMYLYSLVCDGKIIDTKNMLLTN